MPIMKSITDLTWKDAAAVDCSVLRSKLEDIHAELEKLRTSQPNKYLGPKAKVRAAFEGLQHDLTTILRGMGRLQASIEQIEEVRSMASGKGLEASIRAIVAELHRAQVGEGGYAHAETATAMVQQIEIDLKTALVKSSSSLGTN
jgi:hypothetical protein